MTYEEYQRLVEEQKTIKDSVLKKLSDVNNEINELTEEIGECKYQIISKKQSQYENEINLKKNSAEKRNCMFLLATFLTIPVIATLLFSKIGANFLEGLVFFEMVIGIPGVFLAAKENIALNLDRKEILNKMEKDDNEKNNDEQLTIVEKKKNCEKRLIKLNNEKEHLSQQLYEINQDSKQLDEAVLGSLKNYFQEQKLDIPVENNKVMIKTNFNKK